MQNCTYREAPGLASRQMKHIIPKGPPSQRVTDKIPPATSSGNTVDGVATASYIKRQPHQFKLFCLAIEQSHMA